MNFGKAVLIISAAVAACAALWAWMPGDAEEHQLAKDNPNTDFAPSETRATTSATGAAAGHEGGNTSPASKGPPLAAVNSKMAADYLSRKPLGVLIHEAIISNSQIAVDYGRTYFSRCMASQHFRAERPRGLATVDGAMRTFHEWP
ncbi:MAG: hypothetical protein QM788_06580 [Roseateles sp.]|uniref:hypothetical protein n=1 Tax=Roseateles sp. TaxID=1971397 RepID=UPI0039EABA84